MRANPETELQVLATLDDFDSAFANRDPDAVLALFADDPDVMLIGSSVGEVARGKSEIAKTIQKFSNPPTLLAWEWDSRSVSQAGAVAWLFAAGFVVLTDENGTTRSPYRATVILERRNHKWLWLQWHGSEPSPTP